MNESSTTGGAMRSFLTVMLLLSSVRAFSSNLSIEADQQAKQAFFELNFFSEGRGMIMSPGLISMYEFFVPGMGIINQEFMQKNWGLAFDDAGRVSGLFKERYKKLNVGTVGCVVCHSGRAAGQFVIGLGNKNVDVLKMAKDLYRIEKWWDGLKPDPLQSKTYLQVEDNAINFANYLSNERLGNLTQGLVPIAFIRGWFYRVQGMDIPEMSKGQVKIPHLWGYGEKRKVGQFCDGFGDGSQLGWAVAVELAAGQTADTVRNYYDDVVQAETALEFFLPPKYPFEIDADKANYGKALFQTSCATCHGQYEKNEKGFPVYKAPRWIPWKTVQTDYDRLKSNRPAFRRVVEASPLSDIIRINIDKDGYFAPRLDGIWARFPYLHNGSVPTLWDLLQKSENRPVIFHLRDAGEEHRFDPERLGLLIDRDEHTQKNLLHQSAQGKRDLYDIRRKGHSNQGHEFFIEKFDAEQKMALIEYLKTL